MRMKSTLLRLLFPPVHVWPDSDSTCVLIAIMPVASRNYLSMVPCEFSFSGEYGPIGCSSSGSSDLDVTFDACDPT